MTTLTPTTPRTRSAANPLQVRTRIRRLEAVTVTRTRREQALAEAKAREAHAKAELGLAFARMERTYALAVCRLDEFDEYLNAVRARLRHAGYLGSAASPPKGFNVAGAGRAKRRGAFTGSIAGGLAHGLDVRS
jgi:hypothetical protein